MEKLDLNSGLPIGDNLVKHKGFISKISENSVMVSLIGNVNCDACNGKAACGISESNVKEIEIFDSRKSFGLNDHVEVVMEKSLGLKAVFWMYIFPFLLIIFTLIVSMAFFAEWFSGLLSLLILIPYYLSIYLFRNAFKKAFKLSVQT
jgi:positive regulator of sigma E activity